jgi:hypothetical protein
MVAKRADPAEAPKKTIHRLARAAGLAEKHQPAAPQLNVLGLPRRLLELATA